MRWRHTPAGQRTQLGSCDCRRRRQVATQVQRACPPACASAGSCRANQRRGPAQRRPAPAQGRWGSLTQEGSPPGAHLNGRCSPPPTRAPPPNRLHRPALPCRKTCRRPPSGLQVQAHRAARVTHLHAKRHAAGRRLAAQRLASGAPLARHRIGGPAATARFHGAPSAPASSSKSFLCPQPAPSAGASVAGADGSGEGRG